MFVFVNKGKGNKIPDSGRHIMMQNIAWNINIGNVKAVIMSCCTSISLQMPHWDLAYRYEDSKAECAISRLMS